MSSKRAGSYTAAKPRRQSSGQKLSVAVAEGLVTSRPWWTTLRSTPPPSWRPCAADTATHSAKMTSGNLPPVLSPSEEGSAADMLLELCQFCDVTIEESLESEHCLESRESPVLQEVLVFEASQAHHNRPPSQATLASACSDEQETSESDCSAESRGMKRKNEDEDQLIVNQLGEVSSAIKSCEPPDDLKYFAMSLLNHMREVRRKTSCYANQDVASCKGI